MDTGAAYYHVVTRVVDRRMVFDDSEKERFRLTMRAVAEFCGVRILTWCCMSNHPHMLVYIPERQGVSDAELVRRLACIYDGKKVEAFAEQLAILREVGNHEAAERRKQAYTYRMYDLGEFMKTLLQRVSMSYNRRHRRKGPLWEERYKSVLVEGRPGALLKVASYIEPVPNKSFL